MQKTAKRFISAISLTLGLVLFLFACSDTVKNRFMHYDDLAASGIIARGWVPADFPENTFNIREQHNLDSNRVWLESEFSGDLPFHERTLSPLDKPAVKSQLVKKFNLDGESLQFSAISDNEFIAVDAENKKFYYHSRPIYGD